MSCNKVSGRCGTCNKLVAVTSAVISGGQLILNIPAGTYQNGQEVCLLISQSLPASNTPLPVVVTIEGNATQYILMNCNGNYVYSDQLRTRRIYCTSFRSDTRVFKYNGCTPLCCTKFVFLPVTVAGSTPSTSQEIKGGVK